MYKQSAEVLEQLAATQASSAAHRRGASPRSPAGRATQAALAGAGARVLVGYEFRGSMLEDMPYFDAVDGWECDATSLREFEGEWRDPADDEDYRYAYVYTPRAAG